MPTSAESPFFAAYAQRVGIDAKSVSIVDVDAKLAERILASGEVDAMTGLAWSSLPVLLSQKHAARWMLYSSAGLPTCGTEIVSSQAVVDANKGLAAAMVDAVLESVRFTLINPEESAEIFLKAVPEAGLSAGAKEFIRVGMGLHRFAVAKPAAVEHGLGYGDPQVYEAVTDLVMSCLSGPGMTRPAVESWYSNAYAGNIRLEPGQWAQVTAGVGKFQKYLS